MGSPEPLEDRCNAKTRDDGYCTKYPAKNDDGEVINGRCYMHGGHPDVGASESEQRALEHGVHANRSDYYQNLPADEQMWVDELVTSWLQNAPFAKENLGKVELLRQCAIDMHKIRGTNEYIRKEGLTQTNEKIDDDGNRVETEEENILHLATDRLERQTVKRLKELGVLDDPESQKAEATKSLAEVLSSNEDKSGEEFKHDDSETFR